MASGPNGPKPPPTADELEQRRRLALIQRQQSGRGSTILTSGLSGDSPLATQTLLGAG